jgi:hypothetical protein
VAGTGLLWPEYGINTLGDVLPASAYLVKMNSSGSVNFPPNAKASNPGIRPEAKTPSMPWQINQGNPATHSIAILSEGISGIMPGDVIGVFGESGLCIGFVEVNNLKDNLAIMAYADDQYTDNLDGFTDNEEMTFQVYRPLNNDVYQVEVTYDDQQANADRFIQNGISVITGLKVSSVGINQGMAGEIGLYPNPTEGQVKVSGIDDFSQIEIYNTTGRLEWKLDLNLESEITIDVSDLPSGVYQLKFTGTKATVIKKLIRK